MLLVTGANERYLPRMRPYLDSLERYADFPVKFITVGFKIELPYDRIECIHLPRADNIGAPPQTESIQHGSFLNVIDMPTNEVIIYTDGDFIMQRALDDDERALLALKHNQALTSWNGGPHETLAIEAERLGLKTSYRRLADDWGFLDKHIYNVGFIAMTVRTWRRLYKSYLQDWERIGEYFEHMARQQWLISYKLAQLGIEVHIAPWSLHAHGHFGLKPGMERRADGSIYHNGRLAAFRHYL